MSVFETENTVSTEKNILSDSEVLRHTIFTDELLEEINQKAQSYEEIFSNDVTHAFYQENLSQNSLLHKTAEKLYAVLKKGYALNLCHGEFIKNITLLFQYAKGDVFTKLFNELPDALKLFIAYQKTTQMPIHFWFQSLMSQLSINDLMNCFNTVEASPKDIERDRLALEPYLIALDASLQKFDFDTGHEHKSDLLIHIFKLRSVYNYLNANKVMSKNDIQTVSYSFPESYQFLIEAALSIDCGCFLNGLVILSEMVFGGPSEKFIRNVTRLLIKTQAYTLPFSNHGVPLPECLPFPCPRKMFFYTPFILEKTKNTLTPFDHNQLCNN